MEHLEATGELEEADISGLGGGLMIILILKCVIRAYMMLLVKCYDNKMVKLPGGSS